MTEDIIDISLHLNKELVKWPESFGYRSTPVLEIKDEVEANVTKIEMDVHFGTHVDAPLHFLEKGETMTTMPLKKLIGRCFVLNCHDEKVISTEVVSRIPKEAHKVLFKTNNSKLWTNPNHDFVEDFVGIDKKGAELMAEMNLDLVGVDYLSIQGFREHNDTHRSLLRERTVLLEGIDLREVSEGWYELYCLPIKLDKIEAAPCRAILRRINE